MSELERSAPGSRAPVGLEQADTLTSRAASPHAFRRAAQSPCIAILARRSAGLFFGGVASPPTRCPRRTALITPVGETWNLGPTSGHSARPPGIGPVPGAERDQLRLHSAPHGSGTAGSASSSRWRSRLWGRVRGSRSSPRPTPVVAWLVSVTRRERPIRVVRRRGMKVFNFMTSGMRRPTGAFFQRHRPRKNRRMIRSSVRKG